MPRISKSPEERKQEIIETALLLFQEKGYENTTIQDIAQKMNVAQGLCYRYFKSKQEIFSATSDLYASSVLKNISAPISKRKTALEKLNFIISKLYQYGLKHEEFESVFKKEPEISSARLDRVAKKMIEIIIPIVEQGKQEQIFHCNDVPNTVSFLVYGIMHTIHSNMPSQNTKEHILSFTETFKDICRKVLDTDSSSVGVGWIDI